MDCKPTCRQASFQYCPLQHHPLFGVSFFPSLAWLSMWFFQRSEESTFKRQTGCWAMLSVVTPSWYLRADLHSQRMLSTKHGSLSLCCKSLHLFNKQYLWNIYEIMIFILKKNVYIIHEEFQREARKEWETELHQCVSLQALNLLEVTGQTSFTGRYSSASKQRQIEATWCK